MDAMIDAVLVCSSNSSNAAVKIAKSTPSIRRYVTVSLEGFLSGQIIELGQRAVIAFIDSEIAESIEIEFVKALNDIIVSDAIPVAIAQLNGSELPGMLYESEHSVCVYCNDFETESDCISEEINKLLENCGSRSDIGINANRSSKTLQCFWDYLLVLIDILFLSLVVLFIIFALDSYGNVYYSFIFFSHWFYYLLLI